MGLGRRTFAPGEVLTASNVMNYLQDQVVMNFAGTAARGSAIGTAIQEGMVTYQNDSNTMTVYDGSAWKNVFPADASDIASGSLAIARGGTGFTTGAGLIPVIPTSVNVGSGSGSFNSTTGLITITGASSVSVNGCFTSAFTNYRIIFNQSAATAYADGNLRLRASGTDANTNYYRNGIVIDAASATGFNSANDTNYGNALTVQPVSSNAHSQSTIEIKEPFVNKATTLQVINGGWSGSASRHISTTGFHATAAVYDGFTIYLSSGNFAGTFKIYGYN